MKRLILSEKKVIINLITFQLIKMKEDYATIVFPSSRRIVNWVLTAVLWSTSELVFRWVQGVEKNSQGIVNKVYISSPNRPIF